MRISDWSSDVCSSDLACWNAPERDRFRRSALGREGFTRAPLSLPIAHSSRPSALLRNLPRPPNRHHRPMDIYLVGGALRARLLGLAPGDYDFVVVGDTHDTPPTGNASWRESECQ